MAEQELSGTLIRGYGGAGIGVNKDSAEWKKLIPWGTILLQSPHFAKQGLDLDEYFDRCLRPGNWQPGTMNISIAPLAITEIAPDYLMKDVTWYTNSKGVPSTETFLLTELTLEHEGKAYKGLHYFVDPTTKTGCPQPKTMIEVIGEPIMALQYGDTITVKIDSEKIRVQQPGLRDTLTLSGKAAAAGLAR